MEMSHPSEISISNFTYELPPNKIANFPSNERDGSKLLIYKDSKISQTKFKNLPDLLPQKAVLVFNDTKVIMARLNFMNSKNQTIEVFCLSPSEGKAPGEALYESGKISYLCLVGNLRKWKDETLVLKKNNIQLCARLISKNKNDNELEFTWQPEQLNFYEIIEHFGNIPIPPYLQRESNHIDSQRYQTVYANHNGSVAAPTAGLHITEKMLEALEENGTKNIYLTLHVGASTFKPVKSEKMQDHLMHTEWMCLNIETIEKIRNELNQPIICVGTTSLRALESLYWMGLKVFYQNNLELIDIEIKQWEVYDLSLKEITAIESLNALIAWMNLKNMDTLNCVTQILIAPPYSLKIAKGLFTNFHQPQSTLLLLVAAIVGEDWKRIYEYALNHDFRFLSYGDSSLLLK